MGNQTGFNTERKVDVGGEKSVQISIAAKEIATNATKMNYIMIMESKRALRLIHFFFLFSHYNVHTMLLIWIKKNCDCVYW